jgi:hypothetical protein
MRIVERLWQWVGDARAVAAERNLRAAEAEIEMQRAVASRLADEYWGLKDEIARLKEEDRESA